MADRGRWRAGERGAAAVRLCGLILVAVAVMKLTASIAPSRFPHYPPSGIHHVSHRPRLGIALDTSRLAGPARSHWTCSQSSLRGTSFERLPLQAVGGGWGSPGWNWGYAQGEAHDRAFELRSRLRTREKREAWRSDLEEEEKISWEEVKLALALKWQRAARERRGSRAWTSILEDMRLAKFEGDTGQTQLVKAMESVLGEDRMDDHQISEEIKARRVAGRVFDSLEFSEIGL